jgi:hypothetical protein
MDRKEFLSKSIKLGFCSSALFALNLDALAESSTDPDEKLERLKSEKDFIVNWLTDLLDTMDKTLDDPAKAELIAGCGRGCFNRHQFKKDIAAKGKGDIDKLLEAYKQNFEAWIDGKEFHIRFGETSDHCYCPVAQNIPAKPNDIHCECTRATHQAVFEAAFGRAFKADILESLRRGGKTCHFVIHLA